MTTQAAETPSTQSSKVVDMQDSTACRNTKERSLCESRFFTLSLDMLFIVGLDGYLKQVNPMCEKTLKFTTEELLAKPWLEFVHPSDSESTIAQLQKLSTATDTVSFENRYQCKDGSYRWLLWNAALCHEEQLFYAVARDITSRKQAEDELRQTVGVAALEELEHRSLLVESVKDYAIYMLDRNGRVVTWNKGAQRINGYQADEIIGQHFSSFYPTEHVQSGKPEQVLKIAAAEGRFEDETWRLRKDGSQFWANVVVSALRDESGRLRGFATVTRDITERKRAQEALQQAHDELERRVEERTAELQAANTLLRKEIADREQAQQALRRSQARLRRQTQQLKQALRKLSQTQAQLVQTEKMSSLGQLVAGVAHEINNPVSFIYGNIDYASQYIKELMHLLQLYALHYPHPDREIQAFIEDIDLEFLMADMPKLLSSMKLGAERIREIVLSLRNFSRHDQVQKKPFNIHEGIDSTLLILENRLKAKSEHPAIALVKEYGNLPPVECYAGQLNQVFMNILSNAIDALEELNVKRLKVERSQQLRVEGSNLSSKLLPTNVQPADLQPTNLQPATPCIRIRTEVLNSERVLIRIADNGPGIKEEVRSKLFDPFFTTKPVGEGTGLGLFISYQIVVEKHGGKLTCISQPGNGAEFLIEIPIKQRQEEPAFLSRTESVPQASPLKLSVHQNLALGY